MIISRTPYRISLFGGGTDYESFFSRYNSLLVGFTVDKYCVISCRETPAILDHNILLHYSKTEQTDDWDKVLHNGIRGCAKFLNIKCGLEITNHSDWPSMSGVGSSSSFVVGLLNLLHRLRGTTATKKQLAMESIQVERILLGEVGGWQDGIWAAYGGFNSITITSQGKITVRPLPISAEFMEEFRKHILLFYLGNRQSYEISASYEDPKADDKKFRISDIALESISAFTEENIRAVGQLLNQSWQEKRQISNKISTEEIDEIYRGVLTCGAFGGKILGAGGSGFMFILCPPEYQDCVKSKFSKHKITSVNFDFEGSKIIYDSGEKLECESVA